MVSRVCVLDSLSSLDSVFKTLERDGAVGILDVIDCALIDRIESELAPSVTVERRRMEDARTKSKTPMRIGTILSKAPSVTRLLQSHLIHRISEHFLLPHCSCYQLSSIHFIELHPKSPQGQLHRDDVIWPFPGNRPMPVINFLVPLTDFTFENGGTQVVLGSHHWRRDTSRIGPGRLDLDNADPVAAADLAAAALPRGSILPVLGGTIHCAGANNTDKPRHALSISIILGWLRQEENQYLSAPWDLARTFPAEVQRLLGYQIHQPYLGHTGFD